MSDRRLAYVHRTAHQLGMRTTATMMFGVVRARESGQSFQQLYDLQERLGLHRFHPWVSSPNTALGGRRWGGDLARIPEGAGHFPAYLSNFLNVQSVGQPGLKSARWDCVLAATMSDR